MENPNMVTHGLRLARVEMHAGPDTFPNGCMIAEVEVDPETGVVKRSTSLLPFASRAP
jgi:CO/xanthine dehydrogenase Mo-binding subunit